MSSNSTKKVLTERLEPESDQGYDDEVRSSPSFSRDDSSKCYLVLLLVASVLVIFGQWCEIQAKNIELKLNKQSRYASLVRNNPVQWSPGNEYFDPRNLSRTDSYWNNLRFDAGIVAIPVAKAKSIGLPKAQPFPWDDSKGVYLLNAYHNLHCLKNIRHSLVDYRDGNRVKEHLLNHAFHCVDALRQDVICDADDTPRYSGEGQPQRATGIGHVRQCRDWFKLEAWAEQYPACYKHIEPENYDLDALERFKYCSEESPYNEHIHEIFGIFEWPW